MKILITFIACCLSGIFYRFGGMDKPFRSWMRDWICPAFSLIVLFCWWRPAHWSGYLWSIPFYALCGGALSTYWDFINKWFGQSDDKRWYNWFLHGFFVGFSAFVFIFAGLPWWSVVISSVLSGIFMMVISVVWSNVWIEEIGRGIISALCRL